MFRSDQALTTTLPNGLKHVLVDPASRESFRYTLHEIFRQKIYQKPGFEISTHDNIIDIGAHLGLFSLWAAPFAPAGKIVSVEPTSNIDSLKASLAANGLNHVTPLRLGAGGEDHRVSEIVHMRHNSSTSHNAGFRHAWIIRLVTVFGEKTTHRKYGVKPGVERVKTISLASLMDQYFEGQKIHFLKVDCEGAEYEVFENLPAGHFKRIEKIALEFHHFHVSHDYRRLKALFEKNGFEVEIKRSWFHRLVKTGELWARRM